MNCKRQRAQLICARSTWPNGVVASRFLARWLRQTKRPALALGGTAFYAIAGWSVLSRAIFADPEPPSIETREPATRTAMVVTIRIVGSADSVDIYCIPKKGVSAGLVDASPDDALTDFHALCSDTAETPFYER
jgi:hypothetical protein